MTHFQIEELYCPDFTLTRRPTKHTVKKSLNYESFTNSKLDITRPDDSEMIPITEVDELTNLIPIVPNHIENIILSKKDAFNKVPSTLEYYCTKKTTSYDMFTNIIKITYEVPITGFVNNNNSYNSYKTRRSKKILSRKIENPQKRERFIVIGEQIYSCLKTYRPYGNGYIVLNIPAKILPIPEIPSNSQIFRIAKKKVTKNDITFTLIFPVKLNSISIQPESLQFTQVHSTAFTCHGNCTKNKHCITVLENDPGYLSEFKMMIRSPLTNNQWISIGSFVGNNSIFDSTIVSFDEITVKEMRIIPTSYHKSFDKIILNPIGNRIVKNNISSDTVTYALYISRDGSYMNTYTKYHKYRTKQGCSCSYCQCRKGLYKQKSLALRDCIADM
jgi:hypothetical protein